MVCPLFILSYSSQSVIGFLGALSGWFSKADDRHIAHKILKKAESLINDEVPILDVHFLHQSALEVYYKDRESPEMLKKAVTSCQNQIAMAPKAAHAFRSKYKDERLPSHRGYEQLAIIFEKQKQYEEVIKICAQAEIEGWAGDWQNRISRCQKRFERAQQAAPADAAVGATRRQQRV